MFRGRLGLVSWRHGQTGSTGRASPGRHLCSSAAARLVNLARYPIDRLEAEDGACFAASCAKELDSAGVLVLHEFITPKAVEAFLAEERALHTGGATSRVEYDHSTEFNTDLETGQQLPTLEPHRVLKAQQRVLGYHQFNDASIRALFHWPPVLQFVKAVLGHELYLSADPMNKLHSQRYIPGDQLGWHHDKSEFFFNIMMQPSTLGGQFEYVKNSLGKDELVDQILLGGRRGVKTIDIQAGTVVIFKGRENLHRVTPIREGSRDRISVIFNFASFEGGGVLDEDTRRLFFGGNAHVTAT